MKVKDLIELLEKVNPDAEVVYFDDFGDHDSISEGDFTIKHKDWKLDMYPHINHDQTADFFSIPQFLDAHYIDYGE
ncbi:MAG: hypothetical protein CMB80_02125 [Flammeovirgaceae bacterium]|nr:hypothetical protein [Flammeovirgaceae bacterium]|tara:strand:+ start:269 stop:496 length:228 start_codon:yes stop_codon:yes gene_type:complete